MLDPLFRRLVDPPLRRAGEALAAWGVPANAVTLVGLAVGLLAVPLLAHEQYSLALLAILANRALDGLDGAVSRVQGTTAFGGYLDIVCDMLFYAAVPVGFALARPENALWAAILVATFVATATSFLARAALAAESGERDDGARGPKSFFYAAGLIEGSETILAFVIFCLWPDGFAILASIMAILCLWTVLGRVLAARRALH
ncbi:MAG: CDP-alcohol phosphatidyltransferase family protein [Alphaproteobacteria bacterium]|nr:CDP-alcohol phosphatidyltransferase family protein [Alphaproteobacteria bacterium]